MFRTIINGVKNSCINSIARGCVVLPGLITLSLFAGPVQAQYSYHFIEYPGADSTQLFGINNSDKVVGSASMGDPEAGIGFQYDIRKDEFTELSGMTVGFGINNAGVISGGAGDDCALRDKKGNVTILTPPSDPMDPADFCDARGINSSQKIAGFEARGSGWSGFEYDATNDTYEIFLHSPGTTIAHGINDQGQIIGHTTFVNVGDVYPGSPPGSYGFIREADGTENFFRVDGGITRGRGISENGKMTGWNIVVVNNFILSFVGWVADVPSVPGFEDITLTADQILDPGPCNPDVVAPSGDYTLFTDVTPEGIRNDGVVVGICADYHVLFNTPGDPNSGISDVVEGRNVGFIAIPD